MRYHYQPSMMAAEGFAHLAEDSNSLQFSELLQRIQSLALRTQQWITVVGGHRDQIAQLVQAGVSRHRIRWIAGRDHDHREWATEQALLAGTSSLVVSFLGELSPRMQQRIKMASKMSHTHSFVLHESPSRTPLH